ncbi:MULTISPECIES: retropepsin-like aspartic protease family protein [Pseudomonas]|uniref:TIGR02281 family clan AA aspartic protease n=1 Tax=Pseudomonas quercus TaxID=2722792 RepID=A0ABX0YHI5_9PSED|nr:MULTISPECIES: TIGR02281 family clan AA aspartic protease [Pseudomonas]MBF7143750.1 TIGR02281 family clan AA aspartic protease [Pseudomonas sp. LY10J]NJP02372.1 TIGR02281 family clan AA aspartic protease [Pseudomonas quercus]
MTSAPGRQAGRWLMALAWVAGLFLASRFFGDWEQKQENPNREISSTHGAGFVEVRLQGNRQGHFVAEGGVNGQKVSFMIDTGATDVAIPAAVASRLNLDKGMPVTLNTANGAAQGYRTRLTSLELGDIRLAQVSAVVVPGLPGEQILLGMSALRRLEFTLRDGNMLLRQNTH